MPPVLAAGVETIRLVVGRDRHQQGVEEGLERTTTLTLSSHRRQVEEVEVDSIPNFLWRVVSSAYGGANGATWW